MSCEVIVVDLVGEEDLKGRIKKSTERVLSFLGLDNVYLEISLVDGRKMRGLNRRFRNKDRSTSILSFSVEESFYPKKRYLGDLVIDPGYIKKHGQNAEDLVVHGLLHLLGYTHKKKGDKIMMETKEEEVIKAIKNF